MNISNIVRQALEVSGKLLKGRDKSGDSQDVKSQAAPNESPIPANEPAQNTNKEVASNQDDTHNSNNTLEDKPAEEIAKKTDSEEDGISKQPDSTEKQYEHQNTNNPTPADTQSSDLPDLPMFDGASLSLDLAAVLNNDRDEEDQGFFPNTNNPSSNNSFINHNDESEQSPLQNNHNNNPQNPAPNEAPDITTFNAPLNGNEGTAINFSAIAIDPNGDSLTYQWDLDGDGTFETFGQNVSMTYGDNQTLTVSVKVTDGEGGEDIQQQTITINNVAPKIDNLDPIIGNEGEEIQFSVDALDVSGDALTYAWDLDGNGSFEAVGQNVAMTYGDNQSLTVSVKVTDKDGASTIKTQEVTIKNVAPDVDPLTSISGNEGEEIQFSVNATDVNADTLTYAWDLDGNGSFETVGQNVAKTYDNNQSLTVSVKVTDKDGASTIETQDVTINNVDPIVTSFSIPGNGELNTPVNFSVAATDVSADTLNYAWDFDGDNIIDSTDQNPTFTYTTAGTFMVKVIVTDDDGGTATEMQEITISEIISPTPTTNPGSLADTISLESTSSGFDITTISGLSGTIQSVGGIGDINGDGVADFMVTDGVDTFAISGLISNNTNINVTSINPGITINKYTASNTIASPGGDLNNDGFDDFFLTDSSNTNHFIHGDNSFSLPRDFSDISNFNNLQLSTNSNVTSISSGTDTNNDGIDDAVIGNGNADTITANNSGEIIIISGSETSVITQTITGSSENIQFGMDVEILGDTNAGGLADILVSSPHTTDASSTSAFLIFGETIANIRETGDINTNNWGIKITGFSSNEVSIGGPGDINNDGFNDFIIADPNAQLAGQTRGVVTVIFGSATLSSVANIDLTNLASSGVNYAQIIGENDGDRIGTTLEGIGEIGLS